MTSLAKYALRLLCYAWALPSTLIGLLLLATVYWPSSVRWSSGALDVVARRGLIPRWAAGQTHGWIVFYRDDRQSEKRDLRVHERFHVAQCMTWGVMYPVLYGLSSLWALVRGGDYYRDNVFERQAYRRQGGKLPWILR